MCVRALVLLQVCSQMGYGHWTHRSTWLYERNTYRLIVIQHFLSVGCLCRRFVCCPLEAIPLALLPFFTIFCPFRSSSLIHGAFHSITFCRTYGKKFSALDGTFDQYFCSHQQTNHILMWITEIILPSFLFISSFISTSCSPFWICSLK